VKEYEWLIFSDTHTTSRVCQHEKLAWVLDNIRAKNVVANGDIIDVNHTNRFGKKDWNIMSKMRKLSKNSNCYWNAGNHDPDVSKTLSEFIGYHHGLEVRTEVNENKILITHGDQFDSFIGDHPVLTTVAGGLYYWLQAIDPKEQRIPRYFKKRSKNWIQAGQRVRHNAVKWAKLHGQSSIICSHVHQAEVSLVDNITYANSGCFTYPECYYLTIDKLGKIELHTV
jgi:UDP-2,3-diacylglucosamine pyrophosphatase LpxH